MPAVRSATLGLWADVGSAAEPAAQRGISHLVEHMLFKGTQRRTARAIAETMDGVGGNLNAFTDKESTCYYAKVIDHHVPLALDVLADMFLNSLFDAQELAKEQKVVLEEIRMYDDSPDEADRRLVHSHDVERLGFRRTNDRLRGYGQRATGRRPACALARPLHAQHRRSRGRGERRPRQHRRAGGGGFRTIRRQFRAAGPRESAADAIGGLQAEGYGTSLHRARHARALAARRPALRTVRAGHDFGRRYVEPFVSRDSREKRALAYSVYSFQQSYRDAGLFAVSAGTSPASVGECVDVITTELQTMARSGVSDAELTLAKEHI